MQNFKNVTNNQWYMSNDTASDLVILFSQRNFTDDEIKDVTSCFSEFANVRKGDFIRESLGDLPAVIILILIGEGFFRAIGSDVYEKAKQKLIQLLRTKKEPTLKFEMKLRGIDIDISANVHDEQTWNKIFDVIGDAKELAIREIEKKETPTLTEINLGYDGSWKILGGENRNFNCEPILKFYTYNSELHKWKLTRDLGEVMNAYYKAKHVKKTTT